MSAFWEGMAAANASAIETMGELVEIGGVILNAIVDPLEVNDGSAPGGRRVDVSSMLTVPPGTVLRDGAIVKLRGMEGKVMSWTAIGADGHLQVIVGPVNRWDGEIPGV